MEERNNLSALNSFILHIHPGTVPADTLNFTFTYGLGGMGLVLFLLLAVTGILLLFVYEPSAATAYDSILFLQRNISFGQLIRNIHHFSGNILLIVSFLHLLRVFFTGAFHKPRQFNWIIGLGLFLLIIFADFTGYLLPWDQLSFWAVTVCTGMLEYIPVIGVWLLKLLRGGDEVGPVTLTIFFALHSAVIPFSLILLMPFHFWLVRKAGGTVIPRSQDETPSAKPAMAPVIPDLLVREAAVGALLIAFVLIYAVFFNAPLEEAANAGLSPNPAKAPWYFLGFQELLLHFNPFLAVFIIPCIGSLFICLLPWFRYHNPVIGVWFCSKKGRRMGLISSLFALTATPLLVVVDDLLIVSSVWLPKTPPIVYDSFILFVLLPAVIGTFYFLMKRRFKATNAEIIQSIFILLLTAFLVLTVIGVWFRGPKMALTWPG
jgi:quinol-cytochrome oxidoreductase complex cytochrome b subunit